MKRRFHCWICAIMSLLTASAIAALPASEVQESKQTPPSKSPYPPGLAKSKLRPREGTLKAGDAVPALKVWDLEGKKAVALRDLHGKPAVLIFGSCT
jgi:hypothetical protein